MCQGCIWRCATPGSTAMEVATPCPKGGCRNAHHKVQPCVSLLDATARLSRASHMQGSVEAALACYNEAIRLNSRSAASFASRGDAHLATGNTSAARTDFLTAARIDSGNPQYLYKLACALYSQNNLPEALHFAEEAVRKDQARNGMYLALAENLRGAPGVSRQQDASKCSIIHT